MAWSDLDHLDRALWVGSKPRLNVGWQGVSEGVLDVYALDIDERVKALQVRARGFLRRSQLPRRLHTSETNLSAVRDTLHQEDVRYTIRHASNVESQATNDAYQQLEELHNDDNPTSPKVHILHHEDNDFGLSETESLTNDRAECMLSSSGPDDWTKRKTERVTKRKTERATEDAKDKIGSYKSDPSLQWFPGEDSALTFTFEDVNILEKTITEMPFGWSLNCLQPDGAFYTWTDTNTTTSQHPHQEDARTAYGSWFDLSKECRRHWIESETQATHTALPPFSLPTIEELAIESQARLQHGYAEWWLPCLGGLDSHVDQLCATCRHIDFRRLRSINTVVTRITLKPLQGFSETIECSLCRLLARSASIALPKTSKEDVERSRSIVRCAIEVPHFPRHRRFGEISVHFECSGRRMSEPARIHILSPQVLTPPSPPLGEHHITHHGRQVGIQVDIALVKAWLSNCDEYHSRIEKEAEEQGAELFEFDQSCLSSPKSATRSSSVLTFIDVCNGCLVDMDSWPQYVALSYVWGTKQTLINTTSYCEYLHMSGSLSALSKRIPKTIRDAMAVVLALGVRYLWVDSLCITQDDEERKLAQISNMANIYQNAYFTIVAAYGKSCHSGLPGVNVRSRRSFQRRETIQGLELANVLPTYRDTVPRSTWQTRGWTYQESEICPRHLIFTTFQVFYRCNRAIYNEDMGMTPTENVAQYVCKLNLTHTPSLVSYSDALENYTQRTLEKSEDILNAFKGIEAKLQPLVRSDFLFGLPETELDIALLWQPNFSQPLKRRLSEHSDEPMFPSWSWAGWTGNFILRQWSDHLVDDLSRVVWQDAHTGDFFTSDDFRAPLGRSPCQQDANRDTQGSWQYWRAGERFRYDIPCFYEPSTPWSWLLHPTASREQRKPRTLAKPNSHELRFRALVTSFRVSAECSSDIGRRSRPWDDVA